MAKEFWEDDTTADSSVPAESGVDFWLSDKPEAQQDLPDGVAPSTAGAGRGSTSLADYQAKSDAQSVRPARSGWEDNADRLMADTAAPAADRVSVLEGIDLQPGKPWSFREASQVRRAIDDMPQARPEASITETPLATQIGMDARKTVTNPAARGVMAGIAGLGQVIPGAVQAGADLVGADSVSEAAGRVARTGQQVSAPLAPAGGSEKLVFDIANSITQTAPTLIVGLGGGPAMTALFSQSAAQEYTQGRTAGLDGGTAAARAGVMAGAEVLGERFGFGEQISILKGLAKRVPVEELAPVFARQIMKEVPGEQLTTLVQFLGDKYGPGAQNPEAALSDYLTQAGDTLKVTIGQTAAMGGGPVAISAARKQFTRPVDRTPQIEALRKTGDETAAALLERRQQKEQAAYTTEREADALASFGPDLQQRYRDTRMAGTKTGDAVVQTAARWAFEQAAQMAGLSPKAQEAIGAKLAEIPAEKAAGFVQKAITGLVNAGHAQPFDGMETLAQTIETQRDQMLDSVLATMADIETLEAQQDATQEPAQGSAAAEAGLADAMPAAQATDGADAVSGSDQPGAVEALSDTNDVIVTPELDAVHAAATSPLNDLPEPTDAQKKAGNYKVGKIRMSGLDISIENPQDSERRGVDADGKEWATPMRDHYGYFKGTTAADGDKLDVFIKPGTPQDYAGPVFVVDQVDPKTGKFDEHKVVFGAADQAEAEAIYRRNYSADWKGLANITALPMPAFKAWASSKATRKPLGTITEQPNVQDAPQAANDGQAQASPVEARAPEGGNAASNAGVPDTRAGEGVRKDGVADDAPTAQQLRDMPIETKEQAKAYADGYAKRLAAEAKYGQGRFIGANEKPWTVANADLAEKNVRANEAAELNYWQKPYEEAIKEFRFQGLPRAKWEAERKKRGLSTETAAPEAGDVQADGVTLKDGGRITISQQPAPKAFGSLVRGEFGEPQTLIATNDAGEEVGRLTFMPNGGPIDSFVREQDRRRGVGTALYDALEARGGTLPPVESGVAISDDARALRASRAAASKPKPESQPELTDRPDGTLSVKGGTKALRERLTAAGIPAKSIMPSASGVVVGKTQSKAAREVLQSPQKISAMEAQAAGEKARQASKQDMRRAAQKERPAPEGLRVGITPRNAEPVTVREGIIFIGKNEAIDFYSGDPVKVKDGASSDDITKALKDAGALSRRHRVFRSGETEAAGNQGTFDPKNPDIRFAVDDAGRDGDTVTHGQPDARPEARINLELLGRDIAAFLGESQREFDAVRPYDARVLPGAEDLQRIADAFGSEVQGFGMRVGLDDAARKKYGFFGGVRTSGVLFLRDQGGDRPHLAVLGHELAHELRSKQPKLYDQLVDAITPFVNDGKYEVEFVNSVVAKNQTTADKKQEEFIGEVLSDGFMEPEFWRALGRKNPSLLQHVGDFVFDMIEKAMKALGYTKRTAPYLTDFQAVMRTAGEVMAEYGVAPRGARGDMAFSRPLTAELFRQMTTPMQRGMKTADLQKAIAPVLKRWENGPNVTVVATTKDLPMKAPGDVHGVYAGGKVYLVAANIGSKAKAMEVLTHEAIAHHGLREMLGGDWKKFMGNIQLALKTGNKPLAAIRQEVRSAYVDDAGKFNLSELQEADEIAAKVVEQAVDADGNFRPGFGFVKSVYAKVVEFLRSIGIDVKMTHAELQGALVNAQRFLEVGKKAESAREAKEPVFMRSGAPGISTAIIGTNLGAATSHPRYADAKAGDIEAAVDVARALVTAELVDQVRAAIGGSKPVVIPVVSVESSGRNKIPLASAEVLAAKLGLETTTGIVQSNSPKRTAMDGLDRIFSSPEFDGPVVRGQDYVILDDTLTQGATFAALAAHIEAGGGRVVSVVALTGKQYSAKIHPSPETLKSLREKHGDLEPAFQAATGYGFDALTESEARYLSNFKPAQLVRDRILAEGRSRGERQDSRTAGGVAFSRTANAPASLKTERSNEPPTAQAEMFQPGFWDAPQETRLDKVIYELQDGRIDLRRVQEAITKANAIPEKFDARLAETLYPGRVATRAERFLTDEAKPLLDAMARNNVTMDELADYLHARHAEERNKQIAKVNPDLPDGGAGKNSAGVLMTTEAAKQHIAALSDGKRMVLDAMAKRVDAITQGTTRLLVDEGLEKQETIDAWTGAYKSYVPLFRDEAENGNPHPTGAGMSVRGVSSKRAVGSTKKATNILAHVLMQREAAITRAEKNRVAVALYGLALTNPNPDFWTTIKPSMSPEAIGKELQRMGVDPTVAAAGMQGVPTIKTVDPTLGRVVSRPNPMYKSLPGAVVLKVNGEDRVLMLNTNDPRGLRMAENLKNLDGLTKLDLANRYVGKITRWLASVNTQYNPAFGLVNLTRDTLGGAINLSSTKLRGKTMKVLALTPGALKGIGLELAGKKSGEWGRLFRQFQADGGQTGYREMFRDANDRAKKLEAELKAMENAGQLTATKVAGKLLGALDIFNTTLENAVRLAAYREALQEGLSRPEAARLGRELTVDFNRKGRMGRELGPLYAFFNASVQGSARTLQTLAGPAGAKIIAGGLTLGVLQAIMLLAAGYEDDEIPEFVKARALIIPLGTDDDGKKRFFTIPLPLGLHVLPNTGRVLAELTLDGGKDIGSKAFAAVGEIAGAFNPLGGGNVFTLNGLLRTAAPTVVDPFIEALSNENFAGTPIEREKFDNDPRPGFERARESTLRTPTGQTYTEISRIINTMTLGNEYEAGKFSPSPEMVRYWTQVAGGGLLREIEKTVNTSIAMAKGDDTKPTGFPVLGRFYGEVDDASVQSSRYYDNLAAIEKAEKMIRAAEKKGDLDAADRIEQAKPEALLKKDKNRAVRDLRELNKEAMETVGDSEAIKAIDAERTEVMRELNAIAQEADKPRRDGSLGGQLRKALGLSDAQP